MSARGLDVTGYGGNEDTDTLTLEAVAEITRAELRNEHGEISLKVNVETTADIEVEAVGPVDRDELVHLRAQINRILTATAPERE